MSWFVYVAGRKVQCVRCNVPIFPGQFQKAQGSNARCLRCVRLAHLIFVPPGDMALTRRATRNSRRSAIVLQYDRRHGCYERVGILVEPEALGRARLECAGDAEERAERRVAAHARNRVHDAEYVLEFAAQIRAAFPNIPLGRDRTIAEHACVRGSRRVGRTARAKAFDRKLIFRAVCAHIRHRETQYEALISSGAHARQARKAIQPTLHEILKRWGGIPI
jgi:hypothetical protein